MDTSKTDPIAFDADSVDSGANAQPLNDTHEAPISTEIADLSQLDEPDRPLASATATDTEEFVSRAEAEQMAREAYLRGRSERLKADWVDADQPAPDDSLAALFATRPSVWDR